MDRVKHVGNAKYLQIWHTGQPFVRQHQPHNGFGAKCQTHHQRRHDVGAGLDRAACHAFDPGVVLLHVGHGGEQYTIDGSVDVGDNHLGKLITLVVIGKIG